MVRYSYECEICGERETFEFERQSDAKERRTCTICGCTGSMVRLQPKPAVHNRMKRRKA